MPASRDEADRMENPLLGPIAENDVAKLDPSLRHREVRRTCRVFLEVARVEKVVEHPDAEQGGGQVDVQSRDPLQRLVEHDDRGDERKEAARRIAANDHGVAAVEHDDGDGEAAETLHDRTGS